MLFIFPCDYFDKKTPEDYYRIEFEIVKNSGFDVLLIDFDKLLEGTDPFPASAEFNCVFAVWRGWQMTCFQYGEFCIYAARHGITLVTTPETYKANHLLSMSCPRLLHCSVPSVFLEGERFSAGVLRQAVDEVCDGQGRAFVKDYVKGRRDTPCILSQDMDDETLVAEVDSLTADRGESYAGGIAIRKYEPVVGETRFMIVNGKIAAFGAHFSDNAAVTPAELENALNLDTAGAGSRFYTIDAAYAESDGRFLVVETGDGQVSECPEGAEEALIGALGKLI